MCHLILVMLRALHGINFYFLKNKNCVIPNKYHRGGKRHKAFLKNGMPTNARVSISKMPFRFFRLVNVPAISLQILWEIFMILKCALSITIISQ